MSTLDPGEQKELGRRAKPEDGEALWRTVCERVAFEGNWWKFARKRAYRAVLEGTGERMICEGARKDRKWGIGYNAAEAMNYRKNWGGGRIC